MKFHLQLLMAAALLSACSKSKSDTTTPTPVYQPKVSMRVTLWKGPELLNHAMSYETSGWYDATLAGGPANAAFTFEFKGSNGMKKNTDTLVHGFGTTDNAGQAKINYGPLKAYKDGELTLSVTFDSSKLKTQTTVTKDQYTIRTKEDLRNMASYFVPEPGEEYVLGNDIELDNKGKSYHVIGDFEATLDGKGHTISNIFLGEGDGDYALMGFFGNIISTGTVRNIHFKYAPNGLTSAKGLIIGPIAAKCSGKIINCTVNADIIAPESYDASGLVGLLDSFAVLSGSRFEGSMVCKAYAGLVGRLRGGRIAACGTSIEIRNTPQAGGAFLGMYYRPLFLNGFNNDSITNCYAWIKSLPADGKYYFAGNRPVNDGSENPKFLNCYSNTGNVIANFPQPQLYTDVASLTSIFTQMTASSQNWPAGIERPTGPLFKANPDPTKPPLLWWQ
ncbi:hypothetical protein [Chitinophaga sp. Cy-1792]|uniref:hypothetical protein n=1 Tax=Chitinophaga sp. Cy-1792 TaxID=2608339 RepID=UPI00141E700D|nr:hypothetical protein [Chitinophaga sp. Cy-1792]NIG53640.1 hypothetical protein [Chitinophaga sp. Cy-1792]